MWDLERPKKSAEKVYKAQVIESWESAEWLKKMAHEVGEKKKTKKRFRPLGMTTSQAKDASMSSASFGPTLDVEGKNVSWSVTVWLTNVNDSYRNEGKQEDYNHPGVGVSWSFQLDSLFGWMKKKKK